MHRSQFLGLMVGSALAGVPAWGGNGPGCPGGLAGWAARFEASITQDSSGLLLRAQVGKEKCGAALGELCALVDGPLRCEGSRATGTVDGQAFRLELGVV